MLKKAAELLRSCCRETDACARIGGDEFAVILPHTSEAAAMVVRNRILKETAGARLTIDGHELGLSLSIGTATLTTETRAAALVAAADAGMYRVKQASRGELAAR